jgi:hypothetical protein
VTIDSVETLTVSQKLKNAIKELQTLDELLFRDDLEPRILADFRDALNRVRNTAWSAQQYIILKSSQHDPTSLISLLASERVRVTFQLCQSLQADLNSTEVDFQPGQILQLEAAIQALGENLDAVLKS